MITTTIQSNEFVDWLAKSDGYKNSFSYNGAKALFDYLEELSDDIGENIEYDPIAWCCEFTEYESLAEAYKQWRFDYTYVEDEAREYFQENTDIIEFDGGVIIKDF